MRTQLSLQKRWTTKFEIMQSKTPFPSNHDLQILTIRSIVIVLTDTNGPLLGTAMFQWKCKRAGLCYQTSDSGSATQSLCVTNLLILLITSKKHNGLLEFMTGHIADDSCRLPEQCTYGFVEKIQIAIWFFFLQIQALFQLDHYSPFTYTF